MIWAMVLVTYMSSFQPHIPHAVSNHGVTEQPVGIRFTFEGFPEVCPIAHSNGGGVDNMD